MRWIKKTFDKIWRNAAKEECETIISSHAGYDVYLYEYIISGKYFCDTILHDKEIDAIKGGPYTAVGITDFRRIDKLSRRDGWQTKLTRIGEL